jgi:hypothetical protein
MRAAVAARSNGSIAWVTAMTPKTFASNIARASSRDTAGRLVALSSTGSCVQLVVAPAPVAAFRPQR